MIVEHIAALNAKRIILASQSPRRRDILTQLGLTNVEQRPSVDPMVDQRMSSADRGRHEIRDGRREAHRARVWPTS